MERLDALIVGLGLVPSRSKAQRLIRDGHVLVDGVAVTKPAANVATASSITDCRASGSSATASSTASSRFTSSRSRAASSNSRFSAALRICSRSASRWAARFEPTSGLSTLAVTRD